MLSFRNYIHSSNRFQMYKLDIVLCFAIATRTDSDYNLNFISKVKTQTKFNLAHSYNQSNHFLCWSLILPIDQLWKIDGPVNSKSCYSSMFVWTPSLPMAWEGNSGLTCSFSTWNISRHVENGSTLSYLFDLMKSGAGDANGWRRDLRRKGCARRGEQSALNNSRH